MFTMQSLGEVDKESELTVFGYIRSQHKSLLESNVYALFQNIPTSISSLCSLYYYSYDYFDIVHSNMKLSNNKRTINKQTGSYSWRNSNYAKMIISSTDKCICKWYLKFTKPPQKFGGAATYKFIIGLVSNNKYDPSFSGDRHSKFYRHWLNQKFTGKLSSHRTGCYTNSEYGKDVQHEDIICLELDLKKKIISFYINDEDQGIAFKNVDIGEHIQYRLIVSLATNGTSITIIRFTQHF